MRKGFIKIIDPKDNAHVIEIEKEMILEIGADQGVLLLIMIFKGEDTVTYQGYHSIKKYKKQI